MTVGMRDFVPELGRLPLLFRLDPRSRQTVEAQGATLVGTGTSFSGDGVTFDGNGNLSYSVAGPALLAATRDVVIEFTLGFAGNDGVLHYFFDYATIAGAGRFAITKDAADAVVATAGATAVLTSAYATWSAALVAGRNRLVVSTVTGATTAWLNGTSIGTSATAWAAVGAMQAFAIGASYANASRFIGTIHRFEIYGSTATSVDEPLLRAGNLVENVDFSESLATLPLRNYYRRTPGDGLYVTDVLGKGTVTQALWGSDGAAAAQFPGIIRPNGASFDGGDQINLGDADQFSFTNGVNDMPFSLACLAWQTASATALLFNKATTATDGEYILSTILIGGSVRLYLLLNDEMAAAWIGRYGVIGLQAFLRARAIVASYNGTGIGGIRLYVDGVRVDTTNTTSGVYVRMRNTDKALRLGAGNASYTALTGNIVLPSVWDKELSPLQAKALSARMLWEARVS